MADVITRLKVESNEYDSKIKRAQQGLLQMEEACRKVGGTLAVLEKDEKDFVQSLGSMETVSKTARGRLNELTTAFTELSMQYKRLTDEEKRGDFGKALSGSLEQLKTRIAETKGQLADTNRELNGTPSLFDQLTSRLTVNIDAVKLFNVGLQAASAALGVAKDAFFQSESNIDEWGRTVEGAKGAYDVFLSTLNGGNWSGFFSNLEKAIQGGRDLYDALDRLGSIKANNQAAIAMVQAQIQQLRVQKQQGKDVDDEIKSATQRLKELQGQSVRAGKTAGRTEIVNTLRNEVAGRNTTGAQIDDGQLRAASQRVLKEGQSFFDGMAKLVRQYEGNTKYKTTRTTYTHFGATAGGSWGAEVTKFDLSKLSEQQQQQYLIAKAVTEGETRIQAGISTFAQAVREGAQSAREEFRDNRYALTGNGRGSGGTTTKEVVSQMKIPELGAVTLSTTQSMKELQAQLAAYKQQLAAATNVMDYGEAERGIEQTQKRIEAQPLAIRAGLDVDSVVEVQDNLDTLLADMRANIQPLEIDVNTAGSKEVVKTAQDADKAWQAAAQAISSAGSAMQNIENPAAKVAGIVMQAIANIALGYAQATVQAAEMGPVAWIAFALSGLATMIGTISSIKSATSGGFAEGGIVPGNSYSGDNLRIGDYGINSGELVLTRAQTNSLAAQLADGDSRVGTGTMSAIVNAEQLRLVLRNGAGRRGRVVSEWLNG